MGYRRFRDREGQDWEVKALSRDEWEFSTVGLEPPERRLARAPGYERDPFELSQEELQRLLDGATAPRRRQTKNPFGD
jgi:hypothetical protein